MDPVPAWESCAPSSAVPLDRIVFAQRMAFPVFRHHDAREVGMLIEADSKQVEDFALKEIRSRPDGDERIDARVTAREFHLQAHVLLVWNGKQLVHDFKPRL